MILPENVWCFEKIRSPTWGGRLPEVVAKGGLVFWQYLSLDLTFNEGKSNRDIKICHWWKMVSGIYSLCFYIAEYKFWNSLSRAVNNTPNVASMCDAIEWLKSWNWKFSHINLKFILKPMRHKKKKQCCVEFRLSFGLEIRAPLT